MPTFKSLNDFLDYLQTAVDDAVQNEVFEKIKEVLLSHIASDVYGAYPKPKMYDRRGSSGGFSDPANIVNEGSGHELRVVNITPPNPLGEPEATTDKNLASVIETGSGYDYFSPGARPFNENATNDLLRSGVLIDAIIDGLKRQGIKTK